MNDTLSEKHCTKLDDFGAAGLRGFARRCIEECDRDRKVALSLNARTGWLDGRLVLEQDGDFPAAESSVARPLIAGLPSTLLLTSPTKVKRRGFGTKDGIAALVHALAHIEWNAINLAWDAVWRFSSMPREYYDDWSFVAAEESTHFAMLRERLHEFGHEYGDLPAHAGLWEIAEATKDDVLDRMALVPRVFEARGLDVTPGLIAKLHANGDARTAAILEVILRDEVGHVRIGSRWFHHLCDQRGLTPAGAFADAVARHFRGRIKPVESAESLRLRSEAGFRPDGSKP